MIELEEFFIGKGKVSYFEFTQLFKSNKAYMYEIFCPDINERHYETFQRKESKDTYTAIQGNKVFFPARVKYPNSTVMGKWAWCFKEYDKALDKFNEIKKARNE